MTQRRILITRASHQSSELAGCLRALGFEPILIPTIEFTEPTSFASLDAAIASINSFHWLLFTSANAVEAFHRRLLSTHPNSVILSAASRSHCEAESKDLPPSRTPPHRSPLSTTRPPKGSIPNIAVIGPATARALESIGLNPTLIPVSAVAESLAEALLPHARQFDGTPTRFLLLRAEQARDTLPDTLSSAGADVTIAPAYRTTIPSESIPAIQTLFSNPINYPDAITFTSSSTATNLLALLEAAHLGLPPEIQRISIGPITSQTLRDLNFPPHAEAVEPAIPSLVEMLVKSLNLEKTL